MKHLWNEFVLLIYWTNYVSVQNVISEILSEKDSTISQTEPDDELKEIPNEKNKNTAYHAKMFKPH